MVRAAELHHLGADLFIWQTYDPSVKADLFSTGITAPGGVSLVDPISLQRELLHAAIADRPVAVIVITNANHARAAARFALEFDAPIYAHTDCASEGLDLPITAIGDQARIASDLEVITLEGAAPGEIAIHRAADGGTLVIGDALINFGSHSFSFLPAKYCTNPRLLRKSLAKLLDYEFQRILFAHGTPILRNGRERLAELLHGHI